MSRNRLAPLLILLIVSSASGAEPAEVFVPKADGFASIRIPSVVVSKKGTVLAFAEGRAADADQAKNKLIVKRSTNGGKTWGKVAIIVEDGDSALNNPCAVVERESGTVLLMYQSYPAGVGERSGKIQPGYDGDLVVRNWLITSDDGVTWTKPRDITKETKREKVVTTVASGPGIGLQLRHGTHAGRILMPFNEGPFGVWNVYAFYSDDKGKTWAMGDGAPGGLIEEKGKQTSTVNEAQVVELKDGSVRFNVRRWSGKAVRKTCVSADGGKTWSKVEDPPDLADPGCMGSVLRYTDPADGAKSRILFSGPQSAKRENVTVFVSYDEGKTWPVKQVLCKDAFAYSCLTALPDGTIGCLYEAEGTKKIVFARFTLGWLTEGKDRLSKTDDVPAGPSFTQAVLQQVTTVSCASLSTAIGPCKTASSSRSQPCELF
jgi:sialidase-1